MKILIGLVMILNFSMGRAIAGPGNGAGGGLVLIRIHDISAVTTLDGDYARIQDLEDGFVKFDGVNVRNNNVLLNFKNPKLKIESIINSQGIELKVKEMLKN